MKITKDMIIRDILKKSPKSAEVLMNAGMGCVYCPSASMETLEQAAEVHGMDLKKLLKELNE